MNRRGEGASDGGRQTPSRWGPLALIFPKKKEREEEEEEEACSLLLLQFRAPKSSRSEKPLRPGPTRSPTLLYSSLLFKYLLKPIFDQMMVQLSLTRMSTRGVCFIRDPLYNKLG